MKKIPNNRPNTAGEVFFPNESYYVDLANRRWKALQESWEPHREKILKQFAERLNKDFGSK